jgi:hypothetical protein
MANANPTRGGQINLAGDPKAIFLKVFAGEVLTAFSESTQFMDRHTVRSISSGKSAQFPASWKGTQEYHVPGAEILGDTVAFNEVVITIDDLLIAPRFIANLDEAMSHYDVRSILSRDIGMALSRMFDRNVARASVLNARRTANVTGGDGGSSIVAATAKTDADTLIASAFTAAATLDEKNVPSEDRFLFLYPDQYYMLVNSSSKLINRDYGNEGNGSVASGKVMEVAGFQIVKSNNFPRTNTVGDGTVAAQYQVDASTVAGLAQHKSAVGTVKLVDIATEMAYDIRRQGTLLVGKYAVGSGSLRPEAAVEIKTA